ncbi:unnamed protein product, partial [Mesorhabditis spiculigera]
MTEDTHARKPLEFDGVELAEYFQNLVDYEVEFEPENPNFRCLFQRAHVLNASKVLILIEIVVTFLYMIVTFPWWFLWIFFHLPILLASIYAIKKENPTVLWVKLGFMLLYIGLFVSLLILSFVISGFSSQSFLGIFGVGTIESTFLRLLLSAFIKINMIIALLILYWRFTVFWTLKNYFVAKRSDEVDLSDASERTLLQKMLTPV